MSTFFSVLSLHVRSSGALDVGRRVLAGFKALILACYQFRVTPLRRGGTVPPALTFRPFSRRPFRPGTRFIIFKFMGQPSAASKPSFLFFDFRSGAYNAPPVRWTSWNDPRPAPDDTSGARDPIWHARPGGRLGDGASFKTRFYRTLASSPGSLVPSEVRACLGRVLTTSEKKSKKNRK